VRLGIVSDIHANIVGLDKALELMGDVEELLCLGDSIDEYRFSNPVVSRLRERGAHVILGNHEEGFLAPSGTRARERPDVDRGLLAWLAEQPLRRRLDIGGLRLLMVHSTPWDPRGAYVAPHSSDLARFADAVADVVMYGHTHAQVARYFGDTLVLNPGSTGDGRDRSNNRQLSCAVLDTQTRHAEIINFADPRIAAFDPAI
jgi:putative phosphoesterase